MNIHEALDKFCEDRELQKNKHGVMIYTSTNGHDSMNVREMFADVIETLSEQGIVKILKP